MFIRNSLLASCGEKEEKGEKEEVQLGNYEKREVVEQHEKMPETDLIDMSNKGIGPIKNLELPDNIDQGLAECSEVHPCPLHEEFVSIRGNLKEMLANTEIMTLVGELDSKHTFLKL